MEYIFFCYIGCNYDDEIDKIIKIGCMINSYVNFFFFILVKWDVNDDFKICGFYMQILSWFKYLVLVFSVNINCGDNEIKIGNFDLKLIIFYNFDLSVDYYFKSVGLVSVGFFYKKIDDFIVDQVLINYEY